MIEQLIVVGLFATCAWVAIVTLLFGFIGKRIAKEIGKNRDT